MSLYLDSAYVAKCYVTEPDSRKVRELVRAESELHSSAWCVAEVACILHRHTREKSLTREQALKLQAGFQQDVGNGVWLLSPVSEALLHRVERAIQQLPRTFSFALVTPYTWSPPATPASPKFGPTTATC
ncbi:MAG: type II toxin-antitoxin system VapC family toxin [Acidobacteria bacterium]|nr:type II toxin-antitoxin system VapC family toxin [Acidobacteriota bacterium]